MWQIGWNRESSILFENTTLWTQHIITNYTQIKKVELVSKIGMV